jgi:hypothetical protein
VNWPWRRDRIEPTDHVRTCPGCGSRHYRHGDPIVTDFERQGTYFSVVTGFMCGCVNPACRTIFASTLEGVREEPGAQVPQANHDKPVEKRTPPPALRVRPR